MELLMISFAAAWVLRNWWDGRRADYRSADNSYRQCVFANGSKSRPRRSGPDWRYGIGWSVWQLRHGWGPMIQDVRDGWDDAQQGHDKWHSGDSDKRPKIGDAWRAGWRGARKKLPAKQPKQGRGEAAQNGQAKAAAAPKPPPVPGPRTPDIPFAPTNGGTMTASTGEIIGITQHRLHLQQTLANAIREIEAAMVEIGEAEQQITAHELANAQLLNQGLGQETAGGMADQVEAAMQRKQAGENRLAAAERAKAQAESDLEQLVSQGHTTIEEGVKSASAKVADTSYYEN